MRQILTVALLALALSPALAVEDPFGPMLGQDGTTAADSNSDGIRDAADLVSLIKTDPAPQENRALKDFEDKMDQFGALAIDDQRTQLQAWLAARTDVAASGVSPDGCVWARMKTGLPVLFMTNEDPSGAPPSGANRKGGRYAAAQATATALPPVDTKASIDPGVMAELDDTQLPAGNQALLILATDNTWPSYRWAYDFLAGFKDRGFQLPPLSNRVVAALAEYRAIPPISVAITQGHGGIYRESDFTAEKAAADPEHLVLWTNATVGDDDLMRYRSEIRAFRAIPSVGGVGIDNKGDTINGTRWAISAKWVSEYFNFQSNSVWSCQSCSGFNQEMIDAAQSNGLDVYMGWTKPIFSNFGPAVSAVTMSRTMGGPYFYNTDTSPVRPLPLSDAYREAQEAGKTTDANEGGILKIARRTTPGSFFLQVAPSLQFMRMDVAHSQLVLYGQFGSDPGEAYRSVEVDGHPLAINEWTNTRIAAAAPDGVGDVVVKRNRCPSNTKPLIRYKGTFDIDLRRNEGEGLGHMTVEAEVRVDPLPYRLTPRGPKRFGQAHAQELTGGTNPLNMIYLMRLSDVTDIDPAYTFCDDITKAHYQYAGGWQDQSCGAFRVSGSGNLSNLSFANGEIPPAGTSGISLIWILDSINGATPHYVVGIAPPGADATVKPGSSDCESYEENFFDSHCTPGGDNNPSGSGGYMFYPGADLSIPGGNTTVGSGNPTELQWSTFTPSSSPKVGDYQL